jgi:hypothetical protein
LEIECDDDLIGYGIVYCGSGWLQFFLLSAPPPDVAIWKGTVTTKPT